MTSTGNDFQNKNVKDKFTESQKLIKEFINLLVEGIVTIMVEERQQKNEDKSQE